MDSQTAQFQYRIRATRVARGFAVVVVLLVLTFCFSSIAMSQGPPVTNGAGFRIGEKLSYTVSFENVKDAAYLETSVISQGKLGARDVIEVRGRVKTFDLVSAAFVTIDERRTVFADPQSGLPVVIRRTLNDGVLPKEFADNFLATPTTNFDLLTVLYALRNAGGVGSFSISENGEVTLLSALNKKPEHVKTALGEYDTVPSVVTGPYLDGLGIKQLKINLTIDYARLPVAIEFRTAKGLYRAELSSVDMIVPEVADVPQISPTPIPTPVPVATPKPERTPEPYVENAPLLPELSFELGETLEYSMTRLGRPAGTLVLTAPERKLYKERDSLRLAARVSGASAPGGPLVGGDSISAWVDPETLAPIESEMKFVGTLRTLNGTAAFDPRTGNITSGAGTPVESPVGTHTLLSLLYAMRSFNLRASKVSTDAVNDTRVAVYWRGRTYVFTLRPANVESILVQGVMTPTQPVSINTGDIELDGLALKVWLSTDERRVPLRLTGGGYQADLISTSNSLIKK